MNNNRCHISIPKETWGYLVILAIIIVGSMIREINLLIILSGLMIGPLIVNWQVVKMTLRDLHCKRRLPDTAYPGELLTITLEVRNQRKQIDSWGLVLHDVFVRQSPDGSPAERVEAKAFLPHLKPGETRTTTYRGRLWQRGRYRVGPLEISTRVPLGLIQGKLAIADSSSQLWVYPRLGVVSSQWNQLAKVDQLGQRSSRRDQGQLEADFYGLRDWRSGDSQRWIHWRSTAKRNELVVKQFEKSLNQDFVLLLDLRLVEEFSESELPRTIPSQPDRVELAISFVATIVVDHCRRNGGDLVLGVAGYEPSIVRGSASNALVHEALEVLADAQPTESDQFPGILPDALKHVSSDDRVVIVSVNPIDLHDQRRFAKIWKDARQRRLLAKAICVDVSSPDFANWFSYDETPSSRPHAQFYSPS